MALIHSSFSGITLFVAFGLLIGWLGTPQTVQAGYHINLAIGNSGEQGSFRVDSRASKVKKKGGLWKRLSNGEWNVGKVKSAEAKSDVFKAVLKCKVSRRYQIHFRCTSGPKQGQAFVHYHPWSSKEGPIRWEKGQSVHISLKQCG